MSLKEIFCQDKVISILQRAYHADKSAHAYIFAGPEGIGKFKTAREWAKLLLCANPVKEKPEIAQLTITDDTADFSLVEVSGDFDPMVFEMTLKKEDKKTWRIIKSAPQR